MKRRRPALFICLFVLLAASVAWGGAIGSDWAGLAPDNLWSSSANWNPSGAPNNGGGTTYNVSIGVYGVTAKLLGAYTIDSLALGTMTTLDMSGAPGPNSLTLASGTSNFGYATIQGGTLTSNATLTLDQTQFIGTTLNNNGTLSGASFSLGGTLNNSSGSTIQLGSSGRLQLEGGSTVVNNGIIDMSGAGSGAWISLDNQPYLGSTGTTVTMSGNGRLLLGDSGASSIGSGIGAQTFVNGSGHTIEGAGVIGGSTLTFRNQGIVLANQSTGLSFYGYAAANSGSMTANGATLTIGTASFANTGGTIIADAGSVTLQNGMGAGGTLTGGTVNVLNGGMLTVQNQVTVDQATVTVNAGSSALVGSGTIQDSTVNVSSGGTLTLDNATIKNGANASAALNNSGTVESSSGVNILGGRINNNASGVIAADPGAVLQLEAGSTIANNGVIRLGSGSNGAMMRIDASPLNGATSDTLTLAGTGSLTLSNSSDNTIMSNMTPVTLVNAAGHTIQGAGSIGDGTLTFNNQGAVIANQSSGLRIAGLTGRNSGTMTATNGATLTLAVSDLNNSGGTIAANGGMAMIQGGPGITGKVTGGAISVTNLGILEVQNQSVLDRLTLTVDGTSTANLMGSTITDSTVNVNAGGKINLYGGGIRNAANASSVLNNSGTIEVVSGLSMLGGTVNNRTSGAIILDRGTTLALEGGAVVTNDGVIRVGSATGSAMLLIDSSPLYGATSSTVTLSGNGSLTLSNQAGNSITSSTGGVTLINAAGHTIQGAGAFNSPALTLNNQGAVIANTSAGMSFFGQNLINSGTLKATNGAALLIAAYNFTNTGGSIVADGGMVGLSGASGGPGTVTGGTIDVLNSGTLQTLGNTLLNGVAINVRNTGAAVIAGSTLMDSQVTVDAGGTLNLYAATFQNGPLGSERLTNSGQVNLMAGTTEVGGTFTNHATTGRTDGMVNVKGGATLSISAGGSFVNDGTVTVESGGGFRNSGTLTVNASGLMMIDRAGTFSNVMGNVLTGGTYVIAGSFYATGTDIKANAADVTITGHGVIADSSGILRDLTTNTAQGRLALLNGGYLATNSDFANLGMLTIGAGSYFEVGGKFAQTQGDTVVDGTLTAGNYDLSGGTLSGSGDVYGSVTSGATVNVGDDPDTLTIHGNYVQLSGGTLGIDIWGANNFDQLAVTNSVWLDGQLKVNLLSGFIPYERQRFEILTWGGALTGNFANFDASGQMLNGHWHEVWGANSLSLEYVTPEPTTWTLFGAGLAGFALIRRRPARR